MTRTRAITLVLAAGLLGLSGCGALQPGTHETPAATASQNEPPAYETPPQDQEEFQRRVRDAVDVATTDHDQQVGVEVIDRERGLHAHVRGDLQVRTASLDKVPIAMAYLAQRRAAGVPVTQEDPAADLLTRSLTHSENESTSQLYAALGQDESQRVAALNTTYEQLGLEVTRSEGGWGASVITPQDALRVIEAVERPPAWLTEQDADLVRTAMSVDGDEDHESQRFGVGALAGEHTRGRELPVTEIRVKNGWLADDDEDGNWSVSSIGHVRVGDDDVEIAVCTYGSATAEDGFELTSDLSRGVAEAL